MLQYGSHFSGDQHIFLHLSLVFFFKCSNMIGDVGSGFEEMTIKHSSDLYVSPFLSQKIHQ